MMNLPQSYIKNIAIQLRSDYSLSNNPFEISGKSGDSNAHYFGRKKQSKKFRAFLDTGKKGIFLVTGYRGMGKTSFVNHVIDGYISDNKTPKKIVPIHLTISQNNPKELDVLRQVVNSIDDSYKPRNGTFIYYAGLLRKYFLILAVIILGLSVLVKLEYMDFIDHMPKALIRHALVPSIVILVLLTFFREMMEKRNKAHTLIRKLAARCHSTVVEENNIETNLELSGLVGKINNKMGKIYPIADSKEIEYQLQQFLKLTRKEGLEYIFIFDELDKIELQLVTYNLNEDMEAYENPNSLKMDHSLRNRKQAVLGIITGLKNFFTNADARFIFIAGREMFDASLADIADKQSPLSSIFTYTFHIESLLKEEDEGYEGEKNTSSLGIAIENFLTYQLLSKSEIREMEYDKQLHRKTGKEYEPRTFAYLIKSYYDTKDEQSREEFFHVYFVLQGFITYLIYRSSGSPKKMIKAFHEFVVTEKPEMDERTTVTVQKNRDRCLHKSSNYLYFNYFDQYRIGFINSVYRPYIIQHGRSYKLFSENTVISVPYLFDHLFKFHPFAFSFANLELIPEMLSANKTPQLKHDLKQVIDYLYQNHLRDTDVELFNYKFSSKTANEIRFVSRIFEEEAAAFNFTLDESYNVKAILNEKIKEQRSIHSRYRVNAENFNPQIFSIANLNSSLGDLYFFDQEFDDALNCYSDAIRSINNLEISKLNLRDFISLVRNKLKIGLCFEKINSYEEALAFYSDSVQDIKRFFDHYLKNGEYINPDGINWFQSKEKLFYTSSLNDVLQICVQSFLANLYIQEKLGMEGVTSVNMKVEFGDFYRIVDGVGKECGRSRLIIANSLLHQGKLIYYKNTPAIKPYDAGAVYANWFDIKRKKINGLFVKDEKYIKKVLKREPVQAFQYYMIGLDEVMRSRDYFKLYDNGKPRLDLKDTDNDFLYNGKDKVEMLYRYLDALKKYSLSIRPHDESFLASHYKFIASFLSSIGDCILSMTDMNTKGGPQSKYYIDINMMFPGENTGTDFYKRLGHTRTERNFQLTDALRCYYLSARFYEASGRTSGAVFEYRKILHTIMLVASNDGKNDVDNIIQLLEKQIRDKAKGLIHSTGAHSHRHMILKVESKVDDIGDWPLELTIANYAEVKEISLFMEYIRLKISPTLPDESIVRRFIKPNFSMCSQFLRIMELDYYSRYLDRKMDLDDKGPISFIKYDIHRQHILDFLFSKNAIIRAIRIYETDFMMGPGYLAYMHYSIASLLYTDVATETGEVKKISELLNNDEDFKVNLREILRDQYQVIFDHEYHFGMAKDLYGKAIELHTGGAEYKSQMKELIYLEDDFNDNAYHFGAAFERYLMVNNFFSKRIADINIKIKS